jgi:hypothetical protein
MKAYFCLALCCLQLPLRAADPVAADATEPPEVVPSADDLESITVSPSELTLHGPASAGQILVTATFSNGTSADVTRAAARTIDGGSLEVSPTGLVTPRADGSAALRIAWGGKETTLKVTVSGQADRTSPDYIQDVTPVVSRMGCNAGTCHGAKDGKAGFKLSLRGYDPVFDIRAFTDDIRGRRTNAASPDDSLMLLKGSAGVPHEGGQLMKPGDPYYRVLRDWIAAGMPVNMASPRVTAIDLEPKLPVVQREGGRQQFRVVARYADGSHRDVTREAFIETGNADVAKHGKSGLLTAYRRGEAPILARYEGAYASTVLTVMGDRSGFAWQQPPANNRIDELVADKLRRMQTLPSGLCTDLEFVRRLHLDLTGLPPSPEMIRTFTGDPRDSRRKREELIDRLIGSPEFIDHWTNKWADLLQVNSKFLGGEGSVMLRDWIRERIAANLPYDEFVRQILTASGSNRENPAASYYKILREPTEIMENTTHLFLGTRFNCNKCHDHPFERWTQDQYYHLAAYFAQVGLERDPASGDRSIGGTAVEGARPLFEKVIDRESGDIRHDRTGKVAPPAFPYVVPVQNTAPQPRRASLASWITSPENPYFALSYVNRIWGYLTGIGLIEPLDDIRAGNPPSNPELMQWLTSDFTAHHFNVRHLIGTICRSRTYQLSMETNRWNEDDRTNYSHAIPRRLPAEVLYDALHAVTGSHTGLPGKVRASQLADSQQGPADGFLANAGRPVRESSCECERSSDLQLGPIMALISGPTVGDAVSQQGNAIASLTATFPSDRDLISEIYLRVLNRPASDPEITAAEAAFRDIEADHASLSTALAGLEAQLRPAIEAAESAREGRLGVVRADLARYETELAPRLATMEKERAARIDAARTALSDAEKAVAARVVEWEKQQDPSGTPWKVIPATDALSSQNQNPLKLLPDGSYLATGTDGKQDFTLSFPLPGQSLSGVRLEALPDDSLPAKGPGRNEAGNFVLSEIEASWIPSAPDAKPVPIKFIKAIATFQQGQYEVANAINGRAGPDPDGWGIFPDGIGKPQTAIFSCSTDGRPLELGPGQLRIVLRQQYNDGKHLLGRFRISLSSTPGELNFGLPAALTEILAVAPEKRSPEQQKALFDHLAAADPDIAARRTALAEAEKPLPPDQGLADRKAAVAREEQPLPVEPKLAALRRDAALSAEQLANRRLTAAQDLTWALINTPGFLFNY